VNLGGGAARAGLRCSDYQFWHVFRSQLQNGSTWANNAQFDGNRIRAGDPGWGSTPT
jgi:hypothetical protein